MTEGGARALRALAVCTLSIAPIVHGADADLSIRSKLFASRALLPDDDAQRVASGTPADDLELDLRLLGSYSTTSWHFVADHQTTYSVGDSFAFASAPQATLAQTPADDDRRLVDLTWTVDDGDRHRVTHRLDRLAAEYARGEWRATVGRQAVSWGNGVVFQPMDLFNPFAPTVVDRDYKPGDDLVQLARLLPDGGDVQLLMVARRDADHDVTRDAASAGVKWRQPVANAEVELAVGEHYADRVFAVSARTPLGGAVLRADWVLTQLDEGGADLSWIVNLDMSFTLRDTNVYTFAELYRNGFGTDDQPIDIASLPSALVARVQRGETFSLMEHYLAVGARIEWHPLVSQSTTWIGNLDDGSSLVQLQISWDPSDRQRLDAGLTSTFGREGEEYGGVVVGGGLTAGSGTQLYVRWVHQM